MLLALGGVSLVIESIQAMLESEPEQVFGATTDFADGTRYSDDALEIRYPATFFALHRCVYVVWNSTGVDFRKASGRTAPTSSTADTESDTDPSSVDTCGEAARQKYGSLSRQRQASGGRRSRD